MTLGDSERNQVMKTMVHEEAFRGEGLLDKLAQKKIFVCGCGAVGSNLIDNLIRQGFQNIRVIDMDRVEDHNRNTQVWGRREVGQLKVRAMMNRVLSDMGLKLGIHDCRMTAENIDKTLAGSELVVDGFDNTESRQLVTDFCRGSGIDCLHVGLNAGYAEIMWNEQYKVPKKSGVDACEYPLARNTVLMAVAVAADVIVRYVLKGVMESYTITLGDFRVCPYEE